MSCSFVISQCMFYCFGSVVQCLGRCLETYPNLGYVFFDTFFVALSWISTFVLSKVLVYISDDFKIKITSVFGSPDFANIQLFILLRICICLIVVHLWLALGSLMRIKFFRILHQGLWSFKVFAVAAGFAGLIFVPIQVIQIFLKSLTFLLALNFLVNLYVLFKHKVRKAGRCTTYLFEFALNVFLIGNIVLVYLHGLSILTLYGQNTLYVVSCVLLVMNLIRYFQKEFAPNSRHNMILQVYCTLLLWTGWLLVQEKDHLEKVTIVFSTTIGVMNLTIPTLVVFSRSKNCDDDDDDNGDQTDISELQEEEDIELNQIQIETETKRKSRSPQKKKKKKEQKIRSRIRTENSKISLVHFSFMFLISYFLETFICLENLEENLWKFHSHPYIFFIIACICLLLLCKLILYKAS